MMKKSVVFLICLIFVMGNVLNAQNKYIGAAKCKMCHSSDKAGQQYKIWAASGHASAFKTLSSEKAVAYGKKNGIADCSKSPKCLKCHATAASVDAKLVDPALTNAEGVSCESCHGPGSAYKSTMKDHAACVKNGLIDPNQKNCEKCHNKENPFYKPFNFAAAKAKIAHPTPKK